jgi:hypothetical protein
MACDISGLISHGATTIAAAAAADDYDDLEVGEGFVFFEKKDGLMAQMAMCQL